METTAVTEAPALPDARPIPLPVQLSVAGVSFRQDAVRAAYAGETVTVRWVPHPKDPFACEVRGSDHRLLGYVPGAVAPRAVATMGADSLLAGTVIAVVGVETLGLRIKVQSVIAAQDGDGAHLG